MMMRSKCFFLLLSFCEALVLQRGARPLPRHVLRAREETNDDAVDRRGLLSIAATSLVVGGRSTVAAAEVDEEATAAAAAAAFSNTAATATIATAAIPQPFKVSLDVQLERDAAAGTEGKRGEIIVEVMPEWAPLAAERFRELVETGYYDNCRFHRVLPGYIAQWGIASDPKVAMTWLCRTCKRMPDEPRTVSNKKGTLSFASGGKDTRQAQVFLNLGDNGGIPNFLDQQGFTPFARVVSGEASVAGLYSGYGLLESASGGLAGGVSQSKAAAYGAAYLDEVFPKLSSIRSAKVL